MKKCKIISNKQYDFLKKRGTNDALSFINNLICDKIANNEPVIAAFLDLAEAFDTVNHEILINELDNYGVRGKMLDLIKSYLANRYQYVRINNKNSTKDQLITWVFHNAPYWGRCILFYTLMIYYTPHNMDQFYHMLMIR